jgi:hypothetical protein
MDIEKRPKWDIASTIEKGNQSVSLVETYAAIIVPRLQPDEMAQHRANIQELSNRRAGQTENLVDQKSKTLGQDEAIAALYNTIMSLRGIVKSNNTATSEILKAYGVGERNVQTVSGVTAGANIIIAAYKAYTAWSNQAGIIEADITEIQELSARVDQAESAQGVSMYTKKSKTMDKNTLQRAIEDEVTKLSAVGIHALKTKNPGAAALFAGLIPGSSTKPSNGSSNGNSDNANTEPTNDPADPNLPEN